MMELFYTLWIYYEEISTQNIVQPPLKTTQRAKKYVVVQVTRYIPGTVRNALLESEMTVHMQVVFTGR